MEPDLKNVQNRRRWMRDTSRSGLAALALACSVALAASGAAAQTSPSAQSPDPSQSQQSPQDQQSQQGQQSQVNPSADQVQALIQGLAGWVTQSLSGFQPSLGAPVPDELKTQPMPPSAAQALPEAKDHHVAKTDDQTILIVDPVTRQVVGVITATGDSTIGLGTPKANPDDKK
jgi:hypothetical protein